MLCNSWAHFGVMTAAAVLFVGVSEPAMSAVTFSRDTTISNVVSTGNQIKISVTGSGEVDLAFYGNDTFPRYSEVDSSGHIAVDAEKVASYDGRWYGNIMGISRVDGTVRIGAALLGTKTMAEFTRGPSGTFTRSLLGSFVQRDGRPSGGYATDPTTGLGGFLFRDSNNNIVYVHETAQDTWVSTTVEEGVTNNYGYYQDFTYSATGDPIGVYSDGNGNIKAGIIGDSIGTAHHNTASQYHQAIAVGSHGTIYVLNSYPNSATALYTSSDGGDSWSAGAQVIDHGFWGDSKDAALAVAPDNTLAALVYDSNNRLNVATSNDGGNTWDLQELAGGNPQIADLGFDAASHLYVAYYNSNDGSLHLLSTVPEPASGLLLYVGAMVLGIRRRRRL